MKKIGDMEKANKMAKVVSCLFVFAILMTAVPVIAAASNANGKTGETADICSAGSNRPMPPEGVMAPIASLAPGYCPSYGGSHTYEYISTVKCTQNPSGTMTITVDIYIANPSGCSYGEPCPEYDDSPEYVNAWIDWDGDKIWESSERVMDEELTGYENINYHGTMTASKIVTVPSDAVGSTWMRINLGWGYDPNDPCEESWSWGDVVDKEVIFKPEIKDFKVVGGLSQYEGKYKDIVFRRGDDYPLFIVYAVIPSGDKVEVDIYREGETVATLDATGVSPMWNWKSDKWDNIPDDIPVGEYKAKAKIVAEDGTELVSSDEKDFFVIFNSPDGLSDAEKRAYLYGDSKEGRYIKGNYYGSRNDGSTKFFEKEYYLEPVNEHIFGISIHIVDSITEKTTAAEKLCTMVYNIILYSKPHTPPDVPKMLKEVSIEEAIKASEGQEINKIEGQCLDYGNTLTSVLRSVGIGARPATGIWYMPLHNWAYHVWTEAYVPEAPGNDPWYIYDGTLNSYSKRISFSWGKDASEVAVGNRIWEADGGILKRTLGGREITRYNSQANDILFEKCENKKYDDFGCSISTSPKTYLSESSNCSINLTFDKNLTRVGEMGVANITLANYEDKEVIFELNFSVFMFDPSSPIIGYDRLIYYQSMDVTIPSNSDKTLQQTFFINTTNYPYETYIVEVIGKSENESCNATASLEVLPAYDVNISLPDGIGIMDQVPITISICNNVSFIIENITMQIDIPAGYSTSDELIKNISLLIPGACEEDHLILIPTKEDFFPIISLYFTVNSDNGGNYSASLYKKLVEGPKLDIENEYIPFDGEFGDPFEIGFKIKNIGDLAATNVLAEITLPDGVTATETTWNIGDLAGGEIVSLYTNITFTKPEDFAIEVFASDDASHNASGVIYVAVITNFSANFNDVYSDYGLDTNSDGRYDYLIAEVGVNVTSAGIGNIEGWLYDATGIKITKAETSSYLSNGTHSLILKFDGLNIYKHGVNGSYNLKDLELYNENGTLIDSRDYAYTTSAYNYTDFQPLVALTGYYFDYGTDTDGDGLFDNLTVDVGVVLASEGHCVATARLMDTNGEEILWASNISWLPANLSQIIQLNFDGRSIYGNMVDGPYYVRDVYVYHTGDPTLSDYVYGAYTTAAYSYTDFELPPMEDIVIFSNGWWFVDTTGNHMADLVFLYGAPGHVPVVGDINQDGTDDTAVFSNGWWFVDTTGNHIADMVFLYGAPGHVPVVGDINQDGTDDTAVFSNGWWFVDTTGNHMADLVFLYGAPGHVPVVGDINQDGTDDTAVFSNGWWFVDTTGNHIADMVFLYGAPGHVPLVGDINQDGTDDTVIFSGGWWFVDINGNHIADLVFLYGAPDSVPLVGDIW